jgi:hypothetical protein
MLQIDTKIFHEMLGFALPCHTERRITPLTTFTDISHSSCSTGRRFLKENFKKI